MGNEQLALILSREVAFPQGLLKNKVSLVDFNSDLSVAALQGWPLRGVPLYLQSGVG